MNYRINGTGDLMSTTEGLIWTHVPPKRARRVLAEMDFKARINLIQVALAAIALPTLTVSFV